jgi:hypothetical protein
MALLLRAATAAVIFTFGSAASANEGRTRPGGGGKVAEHFHIDPNGCKSGRLPVIKMRQAPKLGKLSFQTRTIPTPSAGFFGGGPCVGKPVRAIIAVYKAGQRPGRDEFRYDFTFPDAPPGTGGSKQVGVTIQ